MKAFSRNAFKPGSIKNMVLKEILNPDLLLWSNYDYCKQLGLAIVYIVR